MQFLTALEAQFGETLLIKRCRKEWARLRQGTKTVRDYVARFRELTLQITDTSEGEKLHRFSEGLTERIRTQVELANPATLDEAVRIAEVWDRSDYAGREVHRPRHRYCCGSWDLRK